MKLLVNLGVSVLSFLATAFITFWMTPFIIDSLGAEAYGFIPLTQQLVSIFSIITLALSSVIARYFTFSINKDGVKEAQAYFSSYFVGAVILSILIYILTMIFVSNISAILEIPNYLLFDVKLAIVFSASVLIIMLFNSLFMTAPFSENKIYLMKFVDLANAIIKSVFIFFLLTFLSSKIWYINLSFLLSTLISTLLLLILFKKIRPEVAISLKYFEFRKLIEMFKSGVWISIGQVGVILFVAAELLIANINLGAYIAGVYGAIIQFSILLRNGSNSISIVFAPMIIREYSNNNMLKIKEYSEKSIKLNSLILFLPSVLIGVFSEPLLVLWLGDSFSKYNHILTFSVAYLCLTLPTLPLVHIFTAADKLKLPGLTNIFFGIINVLLAFYFTKYTDLGMVGLVISGSITLFLKNFIFTPLYSAYITKRKYYEYYSGFLLSIPSLLFLIILSYVINCFFEVNSWAELIVIFIIITIFYMFFVIIFVFNKEEKVTVMRILKKQNIFKRKRD